jgi:hypothetical protein
MKALALLPVALCVLLSGCATPHLVSTKADMSNFPQDRYACLQDSAMAPWYYSWVGGNGRLPRAAYTRCMEARGYTVTGADTDTSSAQSKMR